MKGKLVLFALVALALFAVACSGGTPAAAPAGATAAPSGQNQITLVMWEQSADWRIAAQKYTTDNFTKAHPNVTIKIESFPFVEYQTKINNSLQAGTAPDIITTVGQWAYPWIKAGYLAPFPADVLTPEILQKDFWPGTAAEPVVDGKVYMFPNQATMGTGGLIYNEDLLKAAGIPTPPQFNTWEDLMAAASKCSKFDANGKMTQAGFTAHGVIDSFMFTAFVMQEGQEIIKDGKIAFNNEGGLAALQKYQDMFLKYKVDDPEFPGGLDAFPQGRVCMMNIGAWAGKAAATQNPDLKIRYGPPPPSINAKNPAYVQDDTNWEFVVNAKSKNLPMVWEFLKFYNQKDQWVNRVVFDGEVPANKEAALTFKNDITLGSYIQSAPLSKWSGYKVDREKFNNTINNYLDQLERNKLTPQQALDGLTKDLNAILAGK